MSEITRIVFVSVILSVMFGFFAGTATGVYVHSRMVKRLIKQYEEGR